MKFKKQLVNIRERSQDDDNGVLKPYPAMSLTDWSYRKVGKRYDITHNASGFSCLTAIPKAERVRQICILLESCPEKWDGIGDCPPDNFVREIGNVLRDIR